VLLRFVLPPFSRVTSLSRILSLLVFAALADFATVGVPKRATKAVSPT